MIQLPQKKINSQNTSRYEYLIITGLCVTAAVRIFIFSAAFPFFNNLDEPLHFDLVYKYSHGQLPRSPLEKYESQTARIIADNMSYEYFDERIISLSPNQRDAIYSMFKQQNNLETWAWPTYYVLAGLWCRAGELVGMSGKQLLYWIRFLNIPVAATFVWVSWFFSRKIFNNSFQMRIAIPLLAAFFPQDIFFSITADVLSPLLFAGAFFMLVEIAVGEKTPRYHAFAGLLVAAAFLNKATNLAIVVLAAVVILIKLKQAASQKLLKQYFPSMLAFILTLIIPIAFWTGRNYIYFGDFSGAAASIKGRNWTLKPISEMFNHPVLSPKGAFLFLSGLVASYWRGEFVWQNKRMSMPFMDWFYCISSAILLIFSIVILIGREKTKSYDGLKYRFYAIGSFFVIILAVLLLAILSMRYDFGQCNYPSREFPYFVSGRLIAGTILPFIFLYVGGLHYILSKLRLGSYLLVIVAVIAAGITISEIILTLPVFASPYNWFHHNFPG